MTLFEIERGNTTYYVNPNKIADLNEFTNLDNNKCYQLVTTDGKIMQITLAEYNNLKGANADE